MVDAISMIGKAYRIPWSKIVDGEWIISIGATLHLSLRDAEEYIADYESQITNRSGESLEPDLDPKRDTIPQVEVGQQDMMKIVEYGSTWETGR